jgi:heat shock protein HslJ
VNLPVNAICKEVGMNYRAKLSVIFLVLLAIWLVACKGGSVAFENKEWVLESYGEPENAQSVIEGSEITATFNSTEHEVSGSAGCNSYFGDYEVDGSSLSIPLVGNTEMYCLEPEGVMDQEEQYLGSLGLAESYEIEDGRLRITCSDGTVLVFISN